MAAVETVRPGGDRVANTTHDLYRQYGRQIYAYCFHKLRSKEEAEDAVQTTFMNAFRALQRGTSTQFEQAWLYKIAQNVCFARQSSSSRRRLHEVANDFEVLQEVVPARDSEEPLELIGIEDALEGMPENQRRAILLREWQGLSYREIGEELQLSQAAVEMLIFRARRSLAGALEQPQEQQSKAKRRAARGATFGGLISALKTLLGGGAAIKAVAAAAAVVVVGESAQYTAVRHPAQTQVSRKSAPTVAVHAQTASSQSTVVQRVEPSVISAPVAQTSHVAAQRTAVAPTKARPESHHAGGSGKVGTSAPRPDVEQAPVVVAPAPAPAPVAPAPAPAAPAAHSEPPAAPKVTKSVPPTTTTTPAPPVTVTLPTLSTPPDNGNGKDKNDPAPVVTTPVVTTPDTPPADHGNGNGHGKDKSDPPPAVTTPVVTTPAVAAPDPAPAPAPAPADVQHGNGKGNGNGHGKP